jgi:hypothetical protein
MTKHCEVGRPDVTIHPENDEPIWVAFQDRVLCLPINEASWLASNIHQAIRELERDQIAKATPLAVEQKRTLQVGDKVVVRDDPGTDVVYSVKASPWKLGHGAWVIGLVGISGGYALDRVTGIISSVSSRGPTA